MSFEIIALSWDLTAIMHYTDRHKKCLHNAKAYSVEDISSAYTTPNGEQLITEKMKQKCVVIMLKSKLAPTEDTFPPHVTDCENICIL